MAISQDIVDIFTIIVSAWGVALLIALLSVGLWRYLRIRWYDRDITR